ncbi:DUF6644 family protein [Altericroceibacterium xinjiangense]|uniref:DUF6644 family protein n=1 Tax=Altericroceibacterium xinjiangense TaxID=762261 RepID=UPI000F7EF71A|nr:DUF6644 family protein [Altericroceibacterium xinjiangense]
MPSFIEVLLYLGEWIRNSPVPELSLWIGDQPLSLWMGANFLAIPILQSLHILAIAAAFVSALMINLRILGIGGEGQSLGRTVTRYLPWTWAALGMLTITGLGLVIAEPVREMMNPMFWIKLALVVGLIVLGIVFQIAARRNEGSWATADGGALPMRAGAAAIIVLWCGIIFAGRWIAYAPV